MFEAAELGHKIDKEAYRKAVPELRAALLDAQYDLKENGKIPVVVLVSGQDGAGKGETINVLYEWMDPRYISTLAFSAPTDEERERPFMWRYWRALPPKGRIGIFAGSWYSGPIHDRLEGTMSKAALDQRIDEINRFEAMLVNEGALVLKFWFHLTKDAQKKRLKALERDKDTRWRVTQADWDHFKIYDRFSTVSAHALRHTSTGVAPWIVVEGADEHYRSLTVAKILLDAMRKRVDQEKKGVRRAAFSAPPPPSMSGRDLINTLNMKLALTKKKFDKELEKYQGHLNLLSRHPKFRQRSLIVVFEGSDAAGKGGSIRRITGSLDARQYGIVPIAAPSEEERAQPYLWRFWRHAPRTGRIAIFDRSWYGRVLVERVEGFAEEADWMRAYAEINDFEDQLVRNGAIVAKFWLAITAEEQLKRFKEREKTRFKRFKITEEDWRNRKKWHAYENAVCDMIDRTSTEIAPWTLVEANDKLHARIKVLKTLVERLEAALEE